MKFDSNVPVPKPRGKISVFEEMKVGESFLTGPGKSFYTAYAFGKRKGWTIVRRLQADGTTRVWRTK